MYCINNQIYVFLQHHISINACKIKFIHIKKQRIQVQSLKEMHCRDFMYLESQDTYRQFSLEKKYTLCMINRRNKQPEKHKQYESKM